MQERPLYDRGREGQFSLTEGCGRGGGRGVIFSSHSSEQGVGAERGRNIAPILGHWEGNMSASDRKVAHREEVLHRERNLCRHQTGDILGGARRTSFGRSEGRSHERGSVDSAKSVE